MRPIVGITTVVEDASWGNWNVPAALIAMSYVRAVEAAGGRPLLVPPSVEGIEETLDALDGLIFSGGADLDPGLYGAEAHPETTGTRPDRDRAEAALMEAAMARGMPLLAICRGMQLLNVVRGGDLHQHLPEHLEEDPHRPVPGEFSRHEVVVGDGTKLREMVGDKATVASHHHQAPRRVGAGLRRSASASDGTVEALEDPDADFVVGVLWHPEEDEDGPLFASLVEQAAKYRADRS